MISARRRWPESVTCREHPRSPCHATDSDREARHCSQQPHRQILHARLLKRDTKKRWYPSLRSQSIHSKAIIDKDHRANACPPTRFRGDLPAALPCPAHQCRRAALSILLLYPLLACVGQRSSCSEFSHMSPPPRPKLAGERALDLDRETMAEISAGSHHTVHNPGSRAHLGQEKRQHQTKLACCLMALQDTFQPCTSNGDGHRHVSSVFTYSFNTHIFLSPTASIHISFYPHDMEHGVLPIHRNRNRCWCC